MAPARRDPAALASGASHIRLGRAVLGALASAKDSRAAVEGALREVVQHFGWALGVVWLLDERTGLLAFGGDAAESDALDDVRRVNRRLTFAPGVGLPGAVLDRLEPVTVEDVAAASGFPRREATLETGLSSVAGVPLVSRDGPLGVLEVFARAAGRFEEDRLDALVLAGHQLAEYLGRLRVEERLRASEAMSAAIVDAALDCIVTMDHRGRVVDLNPAAEATFGYGRDAAVGELLADLIIPPDLREAHRTALARYVAHRRPRILNRRLELTGLRADGTRFPVELTVTRLGPQEPPLFAGFLRDITARREGEQRLRGIAEALQSSLLPPHLPSIPGFGIGAAYRPATEGWDVGGDFYDVFETGSGRWALMIGDVCGKGPQAASMTAKVRYAVRAAAVRHDSPSAVLSALNGVLFRETAPGDFCTAIFATFEEGGAGTTVRLAVGGHPLPLVLTAAGDVRTVGRPGTLVGAFASAVSHDVEVALAPDDALVLYTDGVSEAPTAHGLFGVECVHETLRSLRGRPAAAIACGLEAAVVETATRVTDDIAVLVLQAVSRGDELPVKQHLR